MHAENLFFNENEVKDIFRKNIMILWNVYKFYEMYAGNIPLDKGGEGDFSNNVLDEWIIARLNQLIKEVTDGMDNYNLPKATRPITDFVNDFSTWYLRRSRDRFKGDDEADKKNALETTRFVLLELSKLMAPFMPFIAEQIWQKVSGDDFKDENKSVHLEGWPSSAKATEGKSEEILEEMEKARKLVEEILSARDDRGFKIRQPLSEVIITYELKDAYKKIVENECNIKKINEGDLNNLPKKGIWRKYGETLAVDFEITQELKMEGIKRELVRFINALRKDAGMTIKDRAVVYYKIESKEIKEVFEKLGAEIMADTLSDEIKEDNMDEVEMKKEIKIDGAGVILGIKKK